MLRSVEANSFMRRELAGTILLTSRERGLGISLSYSSGFGEYRAVILEKSPQLYGIKDVVKTEVIAMEKN